MSQPPKYLELQALDTMPKQFLYFLVEMGFYHVGHAGLKLLTLGHPHASAPKLLGLQA